jgi:hypothetical protein
VITVVICTSAFGQEFDSSLRICLESLVVIEAVTTNHETKTAYLRFHLR